MTVSYSRRVHAARSLVSTLVFVALLPAVGARAQEPDAVSAMATTGAIARPSYQEYRRNELAYLATRSRTGVISSAAVTAVGLALVVPAATGQCVRIASSASFDEIRCTTTGKTLLGVGAPLLIGGIAGLLVTAIMLGVRKGKIRNIDDQLAYERRTSLRWDLTRSAFAF